MKPAALLTTNVVGGLGNQLFLVANLLATSHRTNIPAFLEPVPCSSSSEAPRPTYWSSIFRDVPQHGVQLTSTPAGSASPLATLPWVTVPEVRPVRKLQLDARRACVYNMVGFFQCAEFFDDYPALRSVIPRDIWEGARVHLQRHYQVDASHTVAVHVRRGDYTRFRDIFVQLEVDYYDAAVRQLLGGMLLPTASATLTAADPHLLIFTDEVRVGQTMAGYFRTKYKGARVSVVSASLEEGGSSGEGATTPREVLELVMMAQCNDVVMANSTFSWWGAYLNGTPLHRVVAPSRWFVKDPYPASNHLYCPGWMLI